MAPASLQEGRLLLGVLLDGLLGGYGDGPGLAPAQPQLVPEEVPHLGQAPADAGLLLDDRSGLLGGAGWVLPEVLFQGVLMLDQGAVGLMPGTAADTRQATFEVLVQVALDGAPGDIGVGGDLVVGQTVALEPENFHLALDAGVGVMSTDREPEHAGLPQRK